MMSMPVKKGVQLSTTNNKGKAATGGFKKKPGLVIMDDEDLNSHSQATLDFEESKHAMTGGVGFAQTAKYKEVKLDEQFE